MSRGSICREEDEVEAVFALGSAINMASIDLARETGMSYEHARNDVTECFQFILRDLFNKHPDYGLAKRRKTLY